MLTLVLLALALTAQDTSSPHVRSTEPKILALIDAGIAGSATFRGLIETLNQSDVIVYIENKTGKKIVLSVADPNQFSLVSGLFQLATGGDEGSPSSGAGDNPVSANAI